MSHDRRLQREPFLNDRGDNRVCARFRIFYAFETAFSYRFAHGPPASVAETFEERPKPASFLARAYKKSAAPASFLRLGWTRRHDCGPWISEWHAARLLPKADWADRFVGVSEQYLEQAFLESAVVEALNRCISEEGNER